MEFSFEQVERIKETGQASAEYLTIHGMNRGLYAAHGTLRYKWESEKISTGRPLLPVAASIGNPFLYSVKMSYSLFFTNRYRPVERRRDTALRSDDSGTQISIS